MHSSNELTFFPTQSEELMAAIDVPAAAVEVRILANRRKKYLPHEVLLISDKTLKVIPHDQAGRKPQRGIVINPIGASDRVSQR